MANTSPFTKTNDPWNFGVKCASAITNTRLAYRLSTTDHETVVLCGDNEILGGLPDRQAAAGEAFNLRMKFLGHLEYTCSEAIDPQDKLTTAANGKVRKVAGGADVTQLIAESKTTADGQTVTARPA